MEVKVAILRGINVGGRRKLLMTELKQVCSALGLYDVITYIQSGNVIFKTDIENKELEQNLEKSIMDIFNLSVPVIVRNLAELKHTIQQNPFYTEEAEINSLHLTFLKDVPPKENVQAIANLASGSDKFKIENKEVFIYCVGKYHQTKLSNGFFEKKLKVGATTRNWKTILKIEELAESIA